jgi:hypothetical protein
LFEILNLKSPIGIINRGLLLDVILMQKSSNLRTDQEIRFVKKLILNKSEFMRNLQFKDINFSGRFCKCVKFKVLK